MPAEMDSANKYHLKKLKFNFTDSSESKKEKNKL